MDRNAITQPTVSSEELISLLSSQIGQLNTEIVASKLLIKKLQELVDDLIDRAGNSVSTISS